MWSVKNRVEITELLGEVGRIYDVYEMAEGVTCLEFASAGCKWIRGG